MVKRKVLIVHVPYQARGGEDVHVDMLADAYARIGVEARFFPTDRKPPRLTFASAFASLFGSGAAPGLAALLAEFRPDFLHIHNLYPTLGPSFLAWASRQKLPILMTAHNHRFYCTNGLALRNGKICKACFGAKIPWKGMFGNCNGNWARSNYYGLAIAITRVRGLLDRSVTKFIAPSPYLRNELTRFGLGACKIEYVLHPTANLPVASTSTFAATGAAEFDAVYAGRLSAEKGVLVLIEAASQLPGARFAIVGDGPESERVDTAAKALPNLKYFPKKSRAEAMAIVGRSRIGVAPSICNDTVSLFALEIFMQGKRLVCSDVESMKWFAGGEFPGHLSRTGDPADLARAIRATLELPAPTPAETEALRQKLGMERFCKDLRRVVDSL